MPTLRDRCKKMMKKRYGKTVNLTFLDKIWDAYVEYAIIRPLIKYGRVQADQHLSFEIVGRKASDVPGAFTLLSKGMAVTKSGRYKQAELLGRNRPDYLYKIICIDTNYRKGQLIFEADKELSKRVRSAIENTQTHYRLAI